MKSKWFFCSFVSCPGQPCAFCLWGTAGGRAGRAMQSVGEGEGEVSIIAWAGYIERGETDPAYDWVTQFEADTSCKVTEKTAATSDEMVALMNEGGFDLVTASGDASNRLMAGGKVQPINLDLIPRYDGLIAFAEGAVAHSDTDDGTATLWRALSVGSERPDVQH